MNKRDNTDNKGLVNHTSAGPLGATAASTMLNMSKISPTAMPETGPTMTAAMTAGTCMMVSDTPLNQGMKPQCVHPKTTAIAPINPVITKSRILFCSVIIIPIFN